MNIISYLDELDINQLQRCRDECNKRIAAIQEEEKKVAWAVSDGDIIVGWYRTEDYSKAIKCLSDEAAERWGDADKENPETKGELDLSIKGHHIPLSEYERLFADGYWGR